MWFPVPLTTFAPLKHGPDGAAPETSETLHGIVGRADSPSLGLADCGTGLA